MISDGVGRDHISDFTVNLIKNFLLEYTQTFAQKNIDPTLLTNFAIDKISFDYQGRRWRRGRYQLPIFNGDYVLLTPKDILTKDESWISRYDLLDRFPEIYTAIPNDRLRSRINLHFSTLLKEDSTRKEMRDAAAETVEAFPQILDYYIKMQEDNSDEAYTSSKRKVDATELQFIVLINGLANSLRQTDFYKLEGNSFSEARNRVLFLKDVIENKDGYRFFYVDGKPVQREADLQLMYRLTWYATSYDVNREVNNGRGPVDFKISRGAADRSLVEFKLASNTKLRRNLEKQTAVYQAASDTDRSVKAIMYFTPQELAKLEKILEDLGLTDRQDVVLIDARRDNKPSGSVA